MELFLVHLNQGLEEKVSSKSKITVKIISKKLEGIIIAR
jgi:hypothetical protein